MGNASGIFYAGRSPKTLWGNQGSRSASFGIQIRGELMLKLRLKKISADSWMLPADISDGLQFFWAPIAPETSNANKKYMWFTGGSVIVEVPSTEVVKKGLL